MAHSFDLIPADFIRYANNFIVAWSVWATRYHGQTSRPLGAETVAVHLNFFLYQYRYCLGLRISFHLQTLLIAVKVKRTFVLELTHFGVLWFYRQSFCMVLISRNLNERLIMLENFFKCVTVIIFYVSL